MTQHSNKAQKLLFKAGTVGAEDGEPATNTRTRGAFFLGAVAATAAIGAVGAVYNQSGETATPNGFTEEQNQKFDDTSVRDEMQREQEAREGLQQEYGPATIPTGPAEQIDVTPR